MTSDGAKTERAANYDLLTTIGNPASTARLSAWTFFPESGCRGRRRDAPERARDEIMTLFASHYMATIGLRDALDSDTIRAYHRRATGEKYLIDPTR